MVPRMARAASGASVRVTVSATPKSATLATPFSFTRMFSGLTSQCTMPCSCAYWRALATWLP